MPTKSRAFTLTELLVVIAIIVVVLSLLLASLRGVTDASKQVDSLNSLRQMAVAHSAYTNEYERFIPGFMNTTLLANYAIEAKLPNGIVLPPVATQSWVWRLAPYAGNEWRTFFRDFRDGALIESLEAKVNNGDMTTVATTPSFGMNSIFVGGDSDHGGPDVTKYSPWSSQVLDGTLTTIAATRVSHVKNPSNLILFAPVIDSAVDPLAAPSAGFPELRAPFLREDQWTVGNRNAIEKAPTISLPAGIPVSRFGGQSIPVSNLDGSASMYPISSIMFDMRRWAPFADAEDWRVPP
jgi:prepilin-type N-terminal cleavage/methylation domain-containing protein